MPIRQATPQDLQAVLAIYAHARESMRASGNPTQWGDSYPPEDLVRADIRRGVSYVLTQGEIPCAVFAFLAGPDPTYANIEQGAWPDDAPYAVVHRVASDGRQKGVLRRCLAFCEARADHIRIDTHADNHIMQHLLESCGYRRCGIIYTDDGSPRIAYHKRVTAESARAED